MADNNLNHYGKFGWRPGAKPVTPIFYRHMQAKFPTSANPLRDQQALELIRAMVSPEERSLAFEVAIEKSREDDGEQSGILVHARRELYL